MDNEKYSHRYRDVVEPTRTAPNTIILYEIRSYRHGMGWQWFVNAVFSFDDDLMPCHPIPDRTRIVWGGERP